MLVTLAVLLLLIVRLQNPDVARALGRLFTPQGEPAANVGRTDSQSVPSSEGGLQIRPTVAAPQPKPAPELPLGPTDEDEEEAAEAREEFQAVTDGTLAMPLQDMFAYRRVVQWVKNQPTSLLEKRARTDLTFNDLMLSPDECRGAW